MSEWQPIETAPKDGTEVDIWVKALWSGRCAGHWRIPNAEWNEERGQWISRFHQDRLPMEYTNEGPDRKSARVVTHWMPLPDPPKAAQENSKP